MSEDSAFERSFDNRIYNDETFTTSFRSPGSLEVQGTLPVVTYDTISPIHDQQSNKDGQNFNVLDRGQETGNYYQHYYSCVMNYIVY